MTHTGIARRHETLFATQHPCCLPSRRADSLLQSAESPLSPPCRALRASEGAPCDLLDLLHRHVVNAHQEAARRVVLAGGLEAQHVLARRKVYAT